MINSTIAAKEIISELEKKSDLEKALYLQNKLIACLGFGFLSNDIYMYLRTYFINKTSHKEYLPSFILEDRSIVEFNTRIKNPYKTNRQKECEIISSFKPLFNCLEDNNSNNLIKAEFDEDHIKKEWKKATNRFENRDIDGAITSARTLLETTLKHILDNKNVEYRNEDSLPKLVKAVTDILFTAPEKEHAEIFKKTIIGIQDIVVGVGSIRNKLGDAHGKSMSKIAPDEFQAEFAVNIAGSSAMFLYKTYCKNINDSTIPNISQ